MKKVKFTRSKWTNQMMALPADQDTRFIIDYDIFYEFNKVIKVSNNGYYAFFDKSKSKDKYIWASWDDHYWLG